LLVENDSATVVVEIRDYYAARLGEQSNNDRKTSGIQIRQHCRAVEHMNIKRRSANDWRCATLATSSVFHESSWLGFAAALYARLVRRATCDLVECEA
jgi:hypothetical protein